MEAYFWDLDLKEKLLVLVVIIYYALQDCFSLYQKNGMNVLPHNVLQLTSSEEKCLEILNRHSNKISLNRNMRN